MSLAAFFDAARALKRELSGDGVGALNQHEVDQLNTVIAGWNGSKNPTALTDEAKFFDLVRAGLSTHLTGEQVSGFQHVLQAMGVARWPLAWAAYGLATAWHETAARMVPVEEAYWLGPKADAYLRTKPYYPWIGRGYVQLTWQNNYRHADEELELGGSLLANPKKALDPDIAARIMVLGMEQGWFCAKKLADYLPLSGRAGYDAYCSSRRIINGTDKADVIAKEAQAFESALLGGGWR